MTALYIVIALLVLFAAFSAGIVVATRRYFPLRGYLVVAGWLRVLRNREALEANAIQTGNLERISIESPAERRLELTRFIWADTGGVRKPAEYSIEPVSAGHPFVTLDGVRQLERLTVRMQFGVDSKVYLLQPASPSGRLVLYHEGHDGGVVLGKRLIASFLRTGFTVIAVAMPLKGENSTPDVDLGEFGRVRLADHDYFRFLDRQSPGFCSLRFFMEPVFTALDHAATRGYSSCAMLGISGGGWATTVAAALDTRIVRSYPTAGSLPFYLRRRHELSDYENHLPAFYSIATYSEMYILGALGAGRRQLQILNKYDSVVWPGERGKQYERRIQEAVARLGPGRFDVLIDDSHVGHKISDKVLGIIHRDLAEA